MLECAENISQSMEAGDKMLWWAEERFLPFTNPSRMTTSTSEFSKYDLKIFPNPSRDFIIIEGDYPQDSFYEVYTMTGQKVLDGTIDKGSSQIDIASLIPDLYILKLNNKTQPIIKID